MADLDGLKTAHDYHTDVPFAVDGAFYVKSRLGYEKTPLEYL